MHVRGMHVQNRLWFKQFVETISRTICVQQTKNQTKYYYTCYCIDYRGKK